MANPIETVAAFVVGLGVIAMAAFTWPPLPRQKPEEPSTVITFEPKPLVIRQEPDSKFVLEQRSLKRIKDTLTDTKKDILATKEAVRLKQALLPNEESQ